MPDSRNGHLHLAVPAPALPTVPVAGSDLRYPVRRIYCVGRNYLAHVKEMGNSEKDPPMFFSKHPDTVVDSGSSIPYPPLTKNFHHEVELVVAIKTGGANIPVEHALDHVYGYAVGFDMTRRDLQQALAKAGRSWEAGKSFDHAGPCGAITPVSAIGHLPSAKIEITVNGQVKQSSNLDQMMWDVPHIIHALSEQVTLAPGDLIFTGTPEGVGPVVSGDVLVGHIDGLTDLHITIA
jgi:fumarylpyruvate hydrolase